MKFDGISIKNYRSFDSEGISLNDLGKLNIIIGKNNSGKSNLLQFISKLGYYHGNKFSKQFFINDRFDFNQSNKVYWRLKLKNNNPEFKRITSHNIPFAEIIKDTKEIVFVFYEDQELNTSKFRLSDSFISDNELNIDTNTLKNWSLKHYRISDANDKNRIVDPIRNSLNNHLSEETYLIDAYRQITENKDSSDPFQKQLYEINGADLINTLDKLKNPKATNRAHRERFESIRAFFRDILNQPKLEIEISSEHPKELSININGDVKPVENLGTGISQLFILALAVNLHDDAIFCIEEPEIFLHPEIQKKFIRFLSKTNNQYFISTHSNSFMNIDDLDIYHFTHDGKRTKVEKVKSSKDKNSLLDDLGYHASDILQTNFILWVEGPSDRIYINHWIKSIDKNLVEGIHYSIMFYGGRLLSHLTVNENAIKDFVHLKKINRNCGIMIDSDKDNEDSNINDTKQRIIKEFKETESLVWLTAGREIENYLSKDLLIEGLKEVSAVSEEISYEKFAKLSSCSKDGKNYSIDKISLAHYVTSKQPDFNVLDLNEKVAELVKTIKKANNLQ